MTTYEVKYNLHARLQPRSDNPDVGQRGLDLLNRLKQVKDTGRAGESYREWCRRAKKVYPPMSETYLATQMTYLRRGQTEELGLDHLRALSQVANVDLSWLATGNGKMDGTTSTPLVLEAAREFREEAKDAPADFILDLVFEYGEKAMAGATKDDFKAIYHSLWSKERKSRKKTT